LKNAKADLLWHLRKNGFPYQHTVAIYPLGMLSRAAGSRLFFEKIKELQGLSFKYKGKKLTPEEIHHREKEIIFFNKTDLFMINRFMDDLKRRECKASPR